MCFTCSNSIVSECIIVLARTRTRFKPLTCKILAYLVRSDIEKLRHYPMYGVKKVIYTSKVAFAIRCREISADSGGSCQYVLRADIKSVFSYMYYKVIQQNNTHIGLKFHL